MPLYHSGCSNKCFEFILSPFLWSLAASTTCVHRVVPFARTLEPYGWGEGCRLEDIYIYIYGISYVGVYKYHEAAWVMISDMGYRRCIYLGCGCDYELWRTRVATVCFSTALEGAYDGSAAYNMGTRGQ